VTGEDILSGSASDFQAEARRRPKLNPRITIKERWRKKS
jgi:hypothetical protein